MYRLAWRIHRLADLAGQNNDRRNTCFCPPDLATGSFGAGAGRLAASAAVEPPDRDHAVVRAVGKVLPLLVVQSPIEQIAELKVRIVERLSVRGEDCQPHPVDHDCGGEEYRLGRSGH